MATLYFLVGIPASGKTTWAENKITSSVDIVHLSSDSLREELYENVNDRDHNNEVFSVMNKRTKENLKNGIDVIYDATNINSKRRVAFLKEFNKIICKKVCVYFSINPNVCMNNDSFRDRQVGDEVIENMYKNLQIPMYHEGWDEIIIVGERSKRYKFNLDNINNYRDFINILSNPITKDCINFAQDNPHHTLSVSRHMYYVYENIVSNKGNDLLKIASILHDIGKPYCKNFKLESRYANYYNHENVSAQLSIRFLLKSGYSDEDIIKISTYIQLHMRLLSVSDKGKEKLFKLVGNKVFDDLVLLRNADIQAK